MSDAAGDVWQCDECGIRVTTTPAGTLPLELRCPRCRGGHFTAVPSPADVDRVDSALRTVEAAVIHDVLRQLLIETFPREHLDTLATALAYELASVVATTSPTHAEAVDVFTAFLDAGINQIRHFGVGKPHP